MTRVHVAGPLQAGARLELPDAAARHVGQVLRMRAGETLVVFDGHGGEYDAAIETVERRGVAIRLGVRREVGRESPLGITLAQCVSKGDRMDYAIQKAVELGVRSIAPLLSSRSVVKLDGERWEKKLEHWRGVVTSACEQSGRALLPQVEAVTRLDAWLATPARGLRLVLAPAGAVALKSLPGTSEITLLVGPEGGLSDDELGRALKAGFIGLGLGPRVLRTETAGVAAIAALQALWGDLG